jgi:ABC-type branched-subunit amino acid transport system substrate-binding protein
MGVMTKTTSYILAGVLVSVAPSAQAADPIKIGMSASLTGPGAESGRRATQGAKLASTRSTRRAARSAIRSNW